MNLKFEVTEDVTLKLNDMMKDIGIDSYKDLFNVSLTLLAWSIEQIKEGKKIGAINDNEEQYTEVQMDIFNHILQSQQPT